MSCATLADRLAPMRSAVDRVVSSRLRLRRQAVGLTQQQLAKLVGVTYQQVHKYETGINRVSVGHLHAIALALGTDVAYFFEHLEPVSTTANDQEQWRRLAELTSNVCHIHNRQHRRVVYAMARALASRSNQHAAELD